MPTFLAASVRLPLVSFKARMINCFSASFTVKSFRANNCASPGCPPGPPRPPTGNLPGQIARRNFFAPAQHHRVLDGRAQFAHVARPGIIHQPFQRVGGKTVHRLCCFPAQIRAKTFAPAAEYLPAVRATAADGFPPRAAGKTNLRGNFPALTSSSRFLLVAVTSRTSAVKVLFEPTRSNVRSPRKRSSFTWMVASISPISSRNNVPPWACSKRPMRRSCAPVNAPFSWPNSSLSSSVGASAAPCTITSGCFARGLSW